MFDNEPTEGFVINKTAGGRSGGWNNRQTVIRIYDPREIEIEINVDNLLFILENCTVGKDKRIEGPLVYAWDRTQLVLLPTGSQEYKQAKEFTAIQAKSIPISEMTEAYRYVMKDTQTVTYLGFHDYYDSELNRYKRIYVHLRHKRSHVFITDKGEYLTTSNTNKVAEKLEIDQEYERKYRRFKQSIYGNPPNKLTYKLMSKKEISDLLEGNSYGVVLAKEKKTGLQYAGYLGYWGITLKTVTQITETEILFNSQEFSSRVYDMWDIYRIGSVNDYGTPLQEI